MWTECVTSTAVMMGLLCIIKDRLPKHSVTCSSEQTVFIHTYCVCYTSLHSTENYELNSVSPLDVKDFFFIFTVRPPDIETDAVNRTVRQCCEGWSGPHCSEGEMRL